MIGISSTEFSTYDFNEVITEVAKQFDHWEIFAEAGHRLPNIQPRLELMKESFNLKYSVHAPISDINIASLNERIREDSVLEILSTLESASALGIDTVTVHPGVCSMAVPYLEEKTIAQAKKSLRALDRISQQYGIMVAVENMPAFPFFIGQTAEDMNDLLDGTDLYFCLDIGHANTMDQIEPLIAAMRDRLVNVHIHDNHGQADEHLTLGEGTIDFKKVLKDLSFYDGNYIIESKSFPSGVESKEYLKGLLQ